LVLFLSGCLTTDANASAKSVLNSLSSLGQIFDRPDTSIAFPNGLPGDFQEFRSRYQQFGTSPEGAIKMYFDAVFCYLEPTRRAEAVKMLRYSMHQNAGWEKTSSNATFVSRLNNPQMHYIFRSFAEGTSPENSYAMSPGNYRLMLESKTAHPDYTQINLRSSGADSARPFQLRQYEGLWYVTNNPGSYADVRKPRNQINTNSHDASYD
jgi:hypothetical protein